MDIACFFLITILYGDVLKMYFKYVLSFILSFSFSIEAKPDILKLEVYCNQTKSNLFISGNYENSVFKTNTTKEELKAICADTLKTYDLNEIDIQVSGWTSYYPIEEKNIISSEVEKLSIKDFIIQNVLNKESTKDFIVINDPNKNSKTDFVVIARDTPSYIRKLKYFKAIQQIFKNQKDNFKRFAKDLNQYLAGGNGVFFKTS